MMISMSKLKLIAASLLTAAGLAFGAGVLGAAGVERTKHPSALPPMLRNSLNPGPQVAEPDRRWIRTLPCGATIEVIGVSAHPSAPNSWWGPDGAPLDQPPCDRSRTKQWINSKSA